MCLTHFFPVYDVFSASLAAAHLPEASVQLEYVMGSGELMHAVNVLGDNGGVGVLGFKFSNDPMSGVGGHRQQQSAGEGCGTPAL